MFIVNSYKEVEVDGIIYRRPLEARFQAMVSLKEVSGGPPMVWTVKHCSSYRGRVLDPYWDSFVYEPDEIDYDLTDRGHP